MTATIDETIELLTCVENVALRLGREDLASVATNIRTRVAAREWMVLLLGETSSGKSTWINSLLGAQVLPATPGATTGTVVEVRFGAADSEPSFSAALRRGDTRIVSFEEFQQLCREPEATCRLRVTWPISRVSSEARESASLEGLILVDAPGYNSCVLEHADILTEVLPEADAVVAMLNFVRDYTPEDASFHQLVSSHLAQGEQTRLLFAVNWMPPTTSGRKLELMREKIIRALDVAQAELYPLASSRVDGKPHVWSQALWSELSALASSSAREALITQSALRMAGALHGKLTDELQARVLVSSAEEADLDLVRDAIARYEALGQQATELVATAEADMIQLTHSACLSARDRLWTAVDNAIEDANRFTGAQDCSAYVKEHLVSLHIRNAVLDLETHLRDRSDRLGEDIERLEAELDAVELPPIRLQDPHWEFFTRHAARRSVRAGAEFLFQQKLRSMGGAAGAQAGFVNMAKHVVSRGGRLFGKTFSREFYNQMGPLLRQLGLRASLATAAIGAVIVEAVTYLYHVVRWKDKLRALIQRALGLPPISEPIEDTLLRKIPFLDKPAKVPLAELANETEESIRETLAATRAQVEMNFNERGETLARALEAREGKRREDPQALQAVGAELTELARKIEVLEGELIHG